MINLFNKKIYRLYAIAIAILLILGSAAIANAKYSTLARGAINQNNKIDYHTEIVGRWQSVDFVKDMSDFKPGSKDFKGDLFVREMNFFRNGKVFNTCFDGKVSHPCFTWTKNIIIDSADKTASKCTINNINGSTYMFFEWKSGDTIRGMKPSYYVLKKISSTPSSDYSFRI